MNWKPESPAVAQLPSLALLSEHRVYRDAQDPSRVHLDALEPRLAGCAQSAQTPRLSARRRSRAVSVAFGPDRRAIEGAHRLLAGGRAVAMSWNSGPYFAWVRRAGGVTLLDHGQTDRGRGHEARIEGVQPHGVELAQANAAAELVHYGRLCGLSVRATAGPAVATELRELVRVGRRASWNATLGDALTVVLVDLLRRERFQVTVASAPVPLRAFDEVRELVLMEWAHRFAGGQSLALPAASVSGLVRDREVDLSIDWRDGDRVPLRVVRSLRYESIASDGFQALSLGLAGRPRTATALAAR